MTILSGRSPSLGAGTCLAAAALFLACSASQPSALTDRAPGSAASSDSGHDALVSRLERERDEADHRARDAQRAASDAQGRCDLTQHELESLRERDSFEETVWYRLGQAEISEGAVRQKMSNAAQARRLSIESALKGVDGATASVEHDLRRVHRVPDVEWPRYPHDLESTLDGLDKTLRDLP